jgi:hypothetical protein
MVRRDPSGRAALFGQSIRLQENHYSSPAIRLHSLLFFKAIKLLENINFINSLISFMFGESQNTQGRKRIKRVYQVNQ